MAAVATRRQVSREVTRRMRLRRYLLAPALVGAAAVTAFGLGFGLPSPAVAQGFTYNRLPPRPKPPPAKHDGQMLVQAAEIDYDYTSQRVSAVGGVQIFFNGSSVEADKVVYDQKTKRLRAEGNVRLTDETGRITYAEFLDLSDDYRDGFVDSLRVDTADQTRMAATRADRSGGRFTVFQNGVYTACAACKDNPKKPPLWQVKGARVIHDEGEKMLYFEDARLEFFGTPIAYLPYFSAPDPTVKRKSGFLMPSISSNSATYGVGVNIPYYFALAPDYDLTLTPRITTDQGVLVDAEFRQRLENGAYSITGYGIRQTDPGRFGSRDSNREWRGGVETHGQFAINDRWVWGWDGTLLSDRYFLSDYSLSVYQDRYGAFLTAPSEATSQLYLTGVGNRSYFDARTYYWLGFSGADVQRQIPWVRPVIDYSNVINSPVLGGEVSYKINLTSLERNQAAFSPTSLAARNGGLCLPTSADPAARTPQNCVLRGIPGDYTRLSAEVMWRRSFTDTIGQIWTPFASLRGDVISASIDSQAGVSNFIPSGTTDAARLMPTLGLEYRYPWINVQPWGTTTIEPIAQVIVRPNEPYAGRLPNEDAQSLTFDDSNLFSVDKFSGWDRIEGGGRANVGVQATTQFDRGGFVSALFGQSYHLFGLNSYGIGSLTNTGLRSGLETDRSDYVARVSFQPNSTYKFTTRARFDEATMDVQRFEAEASANFNRWSVSLMYGNYAAQPEIGFLTRRNGILGTGSIKVNSNWVVTGGARWDLDADQINQYIVGAGYVDDCFVLGVNYVTDYTYANQIGGAPPRLSHSIMVRLGLRTLGANSVSMTPPSQ